MSISRESLEQLWDLEDELGIRREGYDDAPVLTDHQRLILVKAAWESDPRRVPFDEADGSSLANVIRDTHAVLRKLGLHE